MTNASAGEKQRFGEADVGAAASSRMLTYADVCWKNSAGGRQTWEPLPDFLKEYHIQYFTDTGGRRWRKGGGFTLRLSMGGVCLRETALRYSVCLLYWYISTNTDADWGFEQRSGDIS